MSLSVLDQPRGVGTHADDYFPIANLPPGLEVPGTETFVALVRAPVLVRTGANAGARLHAVYRAARFVYGLIELAAKSVHTDPVRAALFREKRPRLAAEIADPGFLPAAAKAVLQCTAAFERQLGAVWAAAARENATAEDKAALHTLLNPLLTRLADLPRASEFCELVRQFNRTDARVLVVAVRPDPAIDSDAELQSRTRLAYRALCDPANWRLRPASERAELAACRFVPVGESVASDL